MLGYVVRGCDARSLSKLLPSYSVRCLDGLAGFGGVLSLLAARPHKGGTRGTIELENADIAAIGSEILYTSLTFQFLALASLDPVFTHHELRSFCAEVLLLG